MRSWPDKLSTSLVTNYDLDALAALTSKRTVDLRTAMARALLEYLSSVVSDLGGRDIRGVQTVLQWGMPNDPAQYPCIVVNSGTPLMPVEEIAPPLTFRVQDDPEDPGVVYYLRRVREVDLRMSVLVWATDTVSRMALCEAISDLLHPVDWMSGFRLTLPYYYGSQASYVLEDEDWEDSPEAAANQRYVANLSVQATATRYVRIASHAQLDVTTQLYIEGEEVAPHA